jgi:hypothetical protein
MQIWLFVLMAVGNKLSDQMTTIDGAAATGTAPLTGEKGGGPEETRRSLACFEYANK